MDVEVAIRSRDSNVQDTPKSEISGTQMENLNHVELDGPKISLFVERGFLSAENAEFLVRMSQSASREPYL